VDYRRQHRADSAVCGPKEKLGTADETQQDDTMRIRLPSCTMPLPSYMRASAPFRPLLYSPDAAPPPRTKPDERDATQRDDAEPGHMLAEHSVWARFGASAGSALPPSSLSCRIGLQTLWSWQLLGAKWGAVSDRYRTTKSLLSVRSLVTNSHPDTVNDADRPAGSRSHRSSSAGLEQAGTGWCTRDRTDRRPCRGPSGL
jgi:hypothetical protein